MTRLASKNSGFTLIELLIVVVILSTLAAIVVPQFASSSDSAKEAAAKSSLSGIRSALEMYRTDKDNYPLEAGSSVSSCTGLTLTTASAVNTDVVLTEMLSNYSNNAGEICNVKSSAHPQGPYLRLNAFPENPLVNNRTIAKSTGSTLGIAGDNATPTTGWKYQPNTGEFIINDTTDGRDKF